MCAWKGSPACHIYRLWKQGCAATHGLHASTYTILRGFTLAANAHSGSHGQECRHHHMAPMASRTQLVQIVVLLTNRLSQVQRVDVALKLPGLTGNIRRLLPPRLQVWSLMCSSHGLCRQET